MASLEFSSRVVCGSAVEPDSRRELPPDGPRVNVAAVVYVWHFRFNGHADDGRVYVGRVVRAGSVAGIFRARCLEHVASQDGSLFHRKVQAAPPGALTCGAVAARPSVSTVADGESWASFVEEIVLRYYGGPQAPGQDDPTKPFNSATVGSPVSAAVRKRLDAVALTRMEQFSRDVQDFYLRHRHTNIPAGTRGRRCGTGFYNMVARVRTRRMFVGSSGWPAFVERLTALDWSWESNRSQRNRLSRTEFTTLPFLQQYWPTAVDRWPRFPTTDSGPLHRLCSLLLAWDDDCMPPRLLDHIRRIGLDREDLRARVGGTRTYARLRVRSPQRSTQVASEQAAL